MAAWSSHGRRVRRTPSCSTSWIETRDGVVHFQIEQICNDNVVGMLAHPVGRAFAAWLAGAVPYREQIAEPPSEREGSVAVAYLGLGVVAVNAALYGCVASEQRGREVMTEREVVVDGGLPPCALLILLAVQAVLREGSRRWTRTCAPIAS
jgi:hypothetical protein